MKKFLKNLIGAFICFALTSVFSGCEILDMINSSSEAPHICNYVEKTYAPTCTAEGYVMHVCDCGEEYADNYVDALGHEFIDYISDNNATCRENGTETAICSRSGCDETDTRIAVGLGDHVYDQEVVDDAYLKTEGTCTRKSIYYKSCVCGLTNDTDTFEYANEVENILIIERNEGESDILEEILYENENHQITVLNIKNTKQLTIDELLLFDTVILVNVANKDLPKGMDEILRFYVYDKGGNLFTVGGNDEKGNANAYNRKDMYNTLYQEILPVQAIEYTPPMGVVFILDTSGSMSTNSRLDYAKASIVEGVESLSEQDYAGVMTLDDANEFVVPMTSAANKTSILNTINSIESASGGTRFSPAIQKAGEALANIPDLESRHIIMVTDGMPSEKFEEYSTIIESNYQQKGVTFSIIGMGTSTAGDSYIELERSVELGNGRLYSVDDEDAIEQMDAEISTIKEEYEYSPTTFTLEITPEYAELYGISTESNFTLDGFYGTKLKKEAVAILTGEYDVPIYAQWNYGEGIVGSFTCDLNGVWSKDLLEDVNGRRLINNIICRGWNV